jgi:hypothetical protein
MGPPNRSPWFSDGGAHPVRRLTTVSSHSAWIDCGDAATLQHHRQDNNCERHYSHQLTSCQTPGRRPVDLGCEVLH